MPKTRRARRAEAARALLLELPLDLAVSLLTPLRSSDLARLAAAGRVLTPLVLATLWARAGVGAQLVREDEECENESDERHTIRRLLELERRRASSCQPLAAARAHSVFITHEGRLLSCGVERTMGGSGLLGHGELSAPLSGLPTPTPIPSMAAIRIVSVSASSYHSLALSHDHKVYSWGHGGCGQLGHGDAAPCRQPRLIEALAAMRVLIAAAGNTFSVAVTEAGETFSWGCGSGGELGQGEEWMLRLPERIPVLAGVTVRSVAAGARHTLAITSDGDLYSWGPHHPRLGHATQVDDRTPKRVEALAGTAVSMVAAGSQHSLALTAQGQLLAWGEGLRGRLGLGTDETKHVPTPVKSMEGKRIVAMAAGGLHSCVVTDDGSVYSWGIGVHGQTGHGNGSCVSIPKKIEGLSGAKIVSIAAGAIHTIAAAVDGSVWGWGQVSANGLEAALGLRRESAVNRYAPMRFPGLKVAVLQL